ncbi:MAG: ABC transporter permease [Candidatus Saccharimonadales bacterium]
MHNLSTVIRFEIVRTLKKKSFWIMAFLFPVMIGGIFGIIFFSNTATDEALKNTEKQKFSFVIYDKSTIIDTSLVTALGGSVTMNDNQALRDVTEGTIDAFFYYPSDLTKQPVQVYGRDVGLFDNGRYTAVAKSLLVSSASKSVDSNVRSILQDAVGFNNKTFKDGQPYDGFKQLIAPGVFLVLFYILIAMFGNQMLSSTIEEKENRVIEMILTTIEARALIIGKILSLIVLAFIQIIVILVPVVTSYLLLREKLALPGLDLSALPFDPVRISIGFLLFVASFILFTGLLVTVGAASPTAKEAGGFLGAVMMLLFGPLYAISLFISAPQSGIVQFLSYFPFTAPIPLLLRNAVGNLSYGEAVIALVILAVSAAIVIRIAVRVFQYGALEYSRRLSLREIIGRR